MKNLFKTYIFCFASTLFCYNSQQSPLVSPQMKTMQSKENTMVQKAIMSQAIKNAKQGNQGGQAPSTSSDVMIVDPVKVSGDWKQAFMMLKQRAVPNLTFSLADGTKIESIENIDSLPGGYLMIFTLKNLHGITYKIIKTSEIMTLSSK